MVVQLVIALVATVVAFLLSAGEAAIYRMSRVHAEHLLTEKRAGAKSLVEVVAEPAPYLSVLAFVRVVAESATAVP